MPSYHQVINSLPVPQYKDKFLIQNQSTNDIIREIEKSFELYKHQGKDIAKLFKGVTPYSTAKKNTYLFKK